MDDPVLVVGDPKQAIYRFRGANIGVYLSATESLDEPFALVKSFRSDPDLVDELNAWWAPEAQPVEPPPDGEAQGQPSPEAALSPELGPSRFDESYEVPFQVKKDRVLV